MNGWRINVKQTVKKLAKLRLISTWLYLEEANEDGVYPQVRGKSSTSRFHWIYKRCLVTFFLSARAANPEAKLVLFSNVDLELSDKKNDKRLFMLLSKLGVSLVCLDYTYIAPIHQRTWRNQFYVLDILRYLSDLVNDDDSCLILDGDIVWSGIEATSNLWLDLCESGSLNMLPIIDKNEKINGLSLEDLRQLLISIGDVNSKVEYAGGEFIALRGDKLKEVYLLAAKYKTKYDLLSLEKNFPLIEEAHLLSMVYAALQMQFGGADKYVKRIWTQMMHYSNREISDINLVCWHLPAEKRFGIRRVAAKYLRGQLETWPPPRTKRWIKLSMELGIPKNSLKKILLDLIISIRDRIRN